MIKIKTETNPKLLKNFSNESFPDICIITTTSQYNLVLAYLTIDSEFFNSIEPDVNEIDLSSLPEKPLVQVLRALYGDQLIAYSVSELEQMFQIIEKLMIEEYKESIVSAIKGNKELMENLEILEFCIKNSLMVKEIKTIHINNNLRALESNKNFLQLNKISLETLIPLLLEYYEANPESGATIINNILENYFNRNGIRPVEFFEKQEDVDVLLSIWEQFHHILHIERKPIINPIKSMLLPEDSTKMGETYTKNAFTLQSKPKTNEEAILIKEKDARIAELTQEIEQQDKIIDKLKNELCALKIEIGPEISSKRIPSNPFLPLDDDENEISILEETKIKKDFGFKSIKAEKSEPKGIKKYVMQGRDY